MVPWCILTADLEPVWKLQDPGCDQGYGSERSPEEEFPPSMPVEEEYDDQDIDLRQMYPFITDGNSFNFFFILFLMYFSTRSLPCISLSLYVYI